MENEKTLVFTKPGNFRYCLEIFECLDDLLVSGFSKTIPVHLGSVPEELIREHYKHIKGKPFYEATIKAFLESERGIVLRGYKGYNIVERVSIANGHTDPQKAEKGTIRQIFSNDSMDIAFREKRYLNNVMHASDPENSEREIELWSPYLKWDNI